MNEKIESLIILFEQETEFYEKLLDISQKEQNIIISGKVDELEKSTQEKEKIILEINKLEKAKVLIFQDLSKENNINPSELTITKIKDLAGKKYLDRLQSYERKIKDVISKLKEITESNTNLIKVSLDYIQFSINLLSSLSSFSIYKDNAKTKEIQKSAKILDKKV